jgi:DNA-binding NarL/FixJ family response regulator
VSGSGCPRAGAVPGGLDLGGRDLARKPPRRILLKDATADDLVAAVRIIAAGEALLAPTVTRRLIEEFVRRPRRDRPQPDRLASLTPREVEVVKLIARGLSNGEIAEALVVAEQTVKTHVGRILSKLNLRDRAQVVVTAYESGLITPGDGA